MATLKPVQLLLLLGVLMWLGVQWTHLAVSPAASEAHVSTVLTTSSESSLRSYSTSSSDPSSTQSTPDEQQLSGCQLQLQQKAQAVLDSCPGLPGYCPRPAEMQKQRKAAYLKSQGPQNVQMAQQKTAVDEFLTGPGFQQRLEQLQQLPDKRGILISAGKSHHVGNTAIILHALRKQYGCTLPVEIAYRGDKEVDAVTRETLEREFAPLHWLDLNKRQYPAHHFSGYTMDRYEPKIYALYHSRFQQVLMLDADNLPARDPSYLFDSPHALQHGAMFWLDYWSPHLSSTTFIGHNSVYTLLGINKEQYWEVLSSGQGWLHRAAESGQMVFDRVRHADVLEYLWWLTSFSNVLYKHVLGDKDTFGFAFAMAGKLHGIYAVAVPPAAAFKDEGTHWHFHAMVQHDHLGQVAFLHRTFEKWNNVTQPPQIVDVVSGPLPNRFILNYMGNRTRALSPDIPHHAMRPMGITCPAPTAKFVVGAQHNSAFDHSDGTGYAVAPSQGMFGGCPLSLFLQYKQVQELGLPISRQPRLETACKHTLQAANQPHGTTQAGWGSMTAAAAAAYGKDQEAARSVSHSLPRPMKGAAVAPSRAGMRRQLLVGPGDASKQQLPQARVSGVQRMRTLQADLSTSTTKDLQVSPGGSQQDRSECTGQVGSYWGQVDEAVWMRACMAQRATMQQSDSQGQQQQQQQQGKHINEQQAGRSVVRAVAAARETVTGNATANVSNLQQGLPECGAVEWSVARYVLHEYADAVAVGPDGKLLFDPDPQLPVLQLAKSIGTSAVKQTGELQDQSPHVQQQQQSPCDLLQGAVSPVDRLQLEVIPAARDWVLQHLDGLPTLTAGKS